MSLTFSTKTTKKAKDSFTFFDADALLLIAYYKKKRDLRHFRKQMSKKAIKVGELLISGKLTGKSEIAKTARYYNYAAGQYKLIAKFNATFLQSR